MTLDDTDGPGAEVEIPTLDAAEPPSEQSARAAAIVFAVGVAVAFPVLVYFGSDRWFFGDEWGLLAARSLTLGDLFEPQNGHWLTLPTLSYQLLYRVFGLHSYLPYMSVVVALHLTLATLIRIVVRRAGVGPWVATIVALVFVFFGAGQQNIYQAIQVSLVGSMVYGLAHLLFADHDGGFDWRDGVGLGFGALSLLSSGLGPPLVVMVGLAVLIRRGWRSALVHTVPLAIMYGVWYLAYFDEVRTSGAEGFAPPEVLARWVWMATSGVFLALGDLEVVAVALAIVLVVGLFVAWRPLPWTELRRRASMPVAMMLGVLVMYTAIGSQRWALNIEFARSSRYLALGAALVLPALAVAADAIVKRWKPFGSVVLLLVVFGVPANVALLYRDPIVPNFEDERAFVLGTAYSDLAGQVRPEVYPNPHQFLTDQVTVGFLRDALESGKLPGKPDVPPRIESNITNRLRVSQSLGDEGTFTSAFLCGPHVESLRLTPKKGDEFGLRGPVQIATRTRSEAERTEWTNFDVGSRGGDLLTVEVEDLILHVRRPRGTTSFTWCTPP